MRQDGIDVHNELNGRVGNNGSRDNNGTQHNSPPSHPGINHSPLSDGEYF